jgi:hypothetical protein
VSKVLLLTWGNMITIRKQKPAVPKHRSSYLLARSDVSRPRTFDFPGFANLQYTKSEPQVRTSKQRAYVRQEGSA